MLRIIHQVTLSIILQSNNLDSNWLPSHPYIPPERLQGPYGGKVKVDLEQTLRLSSVTTTRRKKHNRLVNTTFILVFFSLSILSGVKENERKEWIVIRFSSYITILHIGSSFLSFLYNRNTSKDDKTIVVLCMFYVLS